MDAGEPVALPVVPQGKELGGVVAGLFLGVALPLAVGDGALPHLRLQRVHRGPKGGGEPPGVAHRQSEQPQIVAGPQPVHLAHHPAAGPGGELVLEHLAPGPRGKGEALLLPLAGEGVHHRQPGLHPAAGKGRDVPHRQLQGDGLPLSGAAGARQRGAGALPARQQFHPQAQNPRQGQEKGEHREQQGEHEHIQGDVPVITDEKDAGAQQHQQVAQPAFPHRPPPSCRGFFCKTKSEMPLQH